MGIYDDLEDGGRTLAGNTPDESEEGGGYAEDIINDPADFDGLDIQHCEADGGKPEYFTVNTHYKRGGVDAIGEFETAVEAREYAAEVAKQHGWPVNDFTQ